MYTKKSLKPFKVKIRESHYDKLNVLDLES